MEEKTKPFKLTLPARSRIYPKANAFIEAPAKIGAHLGMTGFIGAYSYIRTGASVGGQVKSIGRYCSIAPGVRLGDGHHPLDWLSSHPFQRGDAFWFTDEPDKAQALKFPPKRRVVVGNDVWIGAAALVMPGVRIGDGAVLAAGCVVTKDVPPYAVVAGVPARILRYRFEPAIIERLHAAQWWRYTASSLAGLPFKDIEKALAELEARKRSDRLCKIDADIYQVTRRSSTIVADPTQRRRILDEFEQHCDLTAAGNRPLPQQALQATRRFKRLVGKLLP